MAIVNSETGEVKYAGQIVATFEKNGYDDSDFAAVVWHGDRAETVWYATTRAYTYNMTASVDASPEVMASYRGWLAAKSAAEVAARDAKRVLEPMPGDLAVGARVAWLRDSKFQARATEKCDRCNGAGHWVNPRNASDRRPCFGCSGSGERVGAKVKGENGKPVWNKIAKGSAGEVIDWTSFGTFYANGYNVPGRDNTTVKVKLDDGRIVNATLAALRLEREPMTAEDAAAKIGR